jgi:GGDEF domain-containing protein
VEDGFMSVLDERRRVLLAARPTETAGLRALFEQPPLDRWEMLDADSVERARFLMQHDPCDILLVDEGLYHTAGPEGLAWLARQREAPTLFLTGMEADTLADAYEQGVSLCLPRRASLTHPRLLAAALARTAQIGESSRVQRRLRDGLTQCRRRVDRLVHLLWRTVPMDPGQQWLSQRHILERLQEEVARSSRHGTVFTVAVGDVQAEAATTGPEDQAVEWATSTLARAKRRCDVAGHYGLRGFLLLMVQTPGSGGVAGCRRLQHYLRDAARQAGGPARVSFGLSSFSEDNATSQGLLSRAEKHLEAARAGQDSGVVGD